MAEGKVKISHQTYSTVKKQILTYLPISFFQDRAFTKNLRVATSHPKLTANSIVNKIIMWTANNLE